MINHETHKTHERWRRVAAAFCFVGRRPATLRVPAIRRGALRQTSLGETRFPREVYLGLAGRLGFIFGPALSRQRHSKWPSHNPTEPLPKVGCSEPVDQACLKRPDRSSPRRQAPRPPQWLCYGGWKPDWNGGLSYSINHLKRATAFVYFGCFVVRKKQTQGQALIHPFFMIFMSFMVNVNPEPMEYVL